VTDRTESAVLDTFHDDYLVGLLAVRRGVVTLAQLEEAVQIRLRSRPVPRLLDVLVALAGVSPEAMLPVHYAFYSLLFGSVAVRLGLIDESQLFEALEVQSQCDPRPLLGSVFLHLGLLTPETLAWSLREQERAWTEALGHGPKKVTTHRPKTRTDRASSRPSRVTTRSCS
jgi:hypothetical protein